MGTECKRLSAWAFASCVGALAVGGCDAPLVGAVDESQANAIVGALAAAGVGASKVPDGSSAGGPSYRIVVAAADVSRSVSVLQAENLPRSPERGLAEVFGEAAIVPSPTEERARWIAALSGELARTIESIDGVVDARVHVWPSERAGALDDTPSAARASVLVRHRAEARVDEDAVRRLVAGAVDGLDAERVVVVAIPARVAAARQGALVRFGPLSVSGSSVAPLTAVLGALLGANVVLALLLTWAWTRRRALADAALPPATS